MISKTKYPITNEQIADMFKKAGFSVICNIEPLGDGEYNAVYSVNADGKDYAVKIAPAPDCDVLTYEKNMMQAEVYWYEQFHKNTSINTPEIIYSDFSKELIGTDWFIMEKIGGNALKHCKLEGEEKTESERAILNMAVQMHAVKGEKFGYAMGKKFDTWYDALKHIVYNLIDDCSKKGYRCKHGERVLKAIEKHKEIFINVECSMVNFDLHTGNVMYDKNNPKGKYWMIDLERGLWADKVIEFINFETLNSIEKKTASLEYYNSISKDKIVVDEGVKIRYAMAQCLMALVMETEKYYRYTPKHFGWWRNVAVGAIFYPQAFKTLGV